MKKEQIAAEIIKTTIAFRKTADRLVDLAIKTEKNIKLNTTKADTLMGCSNELSEIFNRCFSKEERGKAIEIYEQDKDSMN